ncbi:DUF1045 domain-containing protein [Dyella tabacisoli]|uniref:DUF1045 domain-containing protein n=1 Tax=Dyella tabacisoli TaxID=2282381 RepID=A0A369UQ81_9GAMM|nr:DUF1045 domain-containing protein [Dyella tabacisoli]RDD82617.1 DUF1045 domain-containing protein [Dyella tabacisoli]
MRYAIYYCPAAGSELDRFGQDWLATSELPGITSARIGELLRDARRYGWHATIHAPFVLTAGMSYQDLRQAVAAVAQSFTPFALPLKLDRLAGFLALRPSSEHVAIDALAAACVQALEPMRALIDELAKQRRAMGLDATELALLNRYGYPYVLDRYRFHMTLSAPATPLEEQILHQALEPLVTKLSSALIDTLSICREASPGADFELIERMPLRMEKRA